MKMKINKNILGIAMPFLMGCTTMKESLLMGAISGAVSGAVINHAVDRDNSNASTNGAMTGAAVGLAASYFIHDRLESRDAKVRRETLLNLDKFSVSRPSVNSNENHDDDYFVTSPKVETECFDSNVRGNKLIEAHCESVIVERPEWAKRAKRIRKSD